jgi:uncharacterized protein YggT (Ycf19 family)
MQLITHFLRSLAVVYSFVTLAWFVLSWLGAPAPRTVRLRDFLGELTRPCLRVLQPISPRLGTVDLTPLVTLVAVQLVAGAAVMLLELIAGVGGPATHASVQFVDSVRHSA